MKAAESPSDVERLDSQLSGACKTIAEQCREIERLRAENERLKQTLELAGFRTLDQMNANEQKTSETLLEKVARASRQPVKP